MPIGELSRRVGVSSDLVRKWERRYGVLKPGRTSGNRRLYSGVDEARLRLMLGHVRRGVPAAQAAELATAARFRVAGTSGSTGPAPEPAQETRIQLRGALERFDETAGEQILEKLMVTSSVSAILRDVLIPLLGELGDRWADAHVTVAQEHFASAFVHSRLLGLARGWDRGLGPRALLACPPGEQHTFGVIAFGIALHQIGWRITYLGPDTPLDMLAQAAGVVNPRLVMVSAALQQHLLGADTELRSLADRWPLALAGAGALPELAQRCGARHLTSDPVTAAEQFLD